MDPVFAEYFDSLPRAERFEAREPTDNDLGEYHSWWQQGDPNRLTFWNPLPSQFYAPSKATPRKPKPDGTENLETETPATVCTARTKAAAALARKWDDRETARAPGRLAAFSAKRAKLSATPVADTDY